MKFVITSNLSFNVIRIFEDGMTRNALRGAYFYAGKMYNDKNLKSLDQQGVDLFITNDGDSKNSFMIGFMPKKVKGKGYRSFFYKANNAEKLLRQKFKRCLGEDGTYFNDIEKNPLVELNIKMVEDESLKTNGYRVNFEDEELLSKIKNAEHTSYWNVNSPKKDNYHSYWK